MKQMTLFPKKEVPKKPSDFTVPLDEFGSTITYHANGTYSVYVAIESAGHTPWGSAVYGRISS